MLLLPFLLSLSGAPSLMQALDGQGNWHRHLEVRSDSLCDTLQCLSKEDLPLTAQEDDSVSAWRFLREGAHRLSERKLHGAAFQALETARKTGGPEDTLRLEQADELFQGGQTEAALGLNYALEKRFPALRTAILSQRVLFFEDLGMESDARTTRALLPSTDSQTYSGASWSGWYTFDLSDTRIGYAAVKSSLLELARSTRGDPVLGTDGLDTLRSTGTFKEHAAGLTWSRSGERTTLRLSPWGRVQLEARGDTLQLWSLGSRIALETPLGQGSLMAQASLLRTEDRASGTRSTTTGLVQWSRTDGAWPRVFSLSATQGRSTNLNGSSSSHYTTATLQGRLTHTPVHNVQLSANLGLSALFAPATSTIDSVARVVEVSGMRDTILGNSPSKPAWLSFYNPSTGRWDWSPGWDTSMWGAPAELRHGLDFEQRTPASHTGPIASLTAEWHPLTPLRLRLAGNLSWQVWLERSLWNLAELGRDSSGLVTLWHNQEDGRWFVVEPNDDPTSTSNVDRRILPMESFSRRRQDLDLSLTLGATLELGRLGNLEGQWTMEHNWSNVDDKDSDRNVWDLRSLSLSWSLGF